MHLGGRGGLSGWRWIFVIEGLITCVAGMIGYFLLVDFPDSGRQTWKFLNQREREWIVTRIEADRGDTKVPPFNLRKFLSYGADWKIWAYGVILGNTTATGFALAYTLPVILNENLGFSIAAAQCLVAPPYVFAGILMSATGWLGDKYQIRGPIILINMVIALIGLPIMGWHPNASVRYFGVFLVTGGINSNMPAAMAFQANNVRGQWKRAFSSATLVGLGGVGGVAGSLVFRQQDKATGYKPGFYACIGFALLSVVLVIICDLEFYRQNKLADSRKKVLECNEVSVTYNLLRCVLAADTNRRKTPLTISDTRIKSSEHGRVGWKLGTQLTSGYTSHRFPGSLRGKGFLTTLENYLREVNFYFVDLSSLPNVNITLRRLLLYPNELLLNSSAPI